MSGLADQVADRLAELTAVGEVCLVAVSGGADSLALLDLLWSTRERHQRPLVIGHVDHGIASDPEVGLRQIRRWQTQASAMDLPVALQRLSLGAATSETVARHARRQALRQMAQEMGATAILLAHHAEDQAETVLLRVVRGSGPAGLAGMAPRQGPWVRLLLDVPREYLRDHLRQRGVEWWEDPANQDHRHLRSWLRGAVMPRLHARVPDLPEQLGAVARQAAAARNAWDDALEALPALSFEQTSHGISVAAEPLRGYSSALRGALLGALGRRVGLLLAARRVDALERLLGGTAGGIDLAPRWRAELAFGRLRLLEVGGALPVGQVLADGAVWDDGHFLVRNETAGRSVRAGWDLWLPPARYRLRPWRLGDRMRPLGGRGSRPVGVLLKEARIAPEDRRRYPLLVTDDDATILWVPGICRSAHLVPPAGTEAIHVEYARAAVHEPARGQCPDRL